MRNRLAANILRTFSTQVGCQIIAIVSGIFIARMIGPAGKGFASYAATAVMFVSVFFYGFADAVYYQFGKQKHAARAVHAVSLRVVLIALAILTPTFALIAWFVPSQRPLAAALVALPFALYAQVLTPFLLVREKVWLTNLRALVQSAGTAVVTIALLAFTHLGITAVIGAWALFYAVSAVQSYGGMREMLAQPAGADDEPRRLWREQLRFGLRAAGGSAAGFLNLRIAVFIVSVLFSGTLLGIYTLAMASGELLWQVSRAFVWPALGRIGSDSLPDAAQLVARLTRNIFAIVAVLGVIAFAIGPWLIVHVYGPAFAPAGAALRWALPGMVAYSAEIALTQFIVLQLLRPVAVIWIQTSGAALCAMLTIVSAPHLGIVGAAAATSLTYLAVTVALGTMFVRGTGISPLRILCIQPEDLAHYADMLRAASRVVRWRSA